MNATRVYRFLLRVGPPYLRERHGAEMEEVFADALRTARAEGAQPAVIWIRAALDLVSARLASVRRPSRPMNPVDEGRHSMVSSDLRYALRAIARQKLGTGLVVGMLSLGIAANVAVFSLVNGIFLRPFPLPDPDRVVYFNETAPKWNLDITGINYADFVVWRQGQHAFQALGVYQANRFNLVTNGRAERIPGLQVTYDFADALGVKPILGRTFTPEEDKPHGPNVVVIGEGLWRERFGGDRDVLGKTLRLDGRPYTIVGVIPAAADFPDEARLWVPLAQDPTPPGGSYNFEGIGRLKPGVTAADANRDLLRAHQPVFDKYDKDRIVSPFVKPLREQLVHDFRSIAKTLLGAVGLLLLVACANVASIMLARSLARRREMGIRLALGASRTRLLRQLLLENLVLGAIGCGVGLLVGSWAVRLLVESVPDEVPHWTTFTTDWRVLLFAVATVLATVVVFGWAPALHAIGGDLRSAVHDVSKGATGSRRSRRTLGLLVGAEFAMAALLLTCGGLLFRAFDRVRSVDPGFRTDHLLTFVVPLPEAKYDSLDKRLAFWNSLDEQLAALPGVESAGLITCAPFGCHWGSFFRIEGEAPPAPGASRPVTLYLYASASYFKTAGIRLREGRVFDEHDGRAYHDGVAPAVVINETFAHTFFPDGRNPIGRRIKFNDDRLPWMTVVGLTADVKHYGLERPMRPGIYLPLPTIAPADKTNSNLPPLGGLVGLVRTSGDPLAEIGSVRALLGRIDPEIPLFRPQSMEETIRRSLSVRAVYSWMLGVFAGLALILAVGGAYGVATYLVTQRTREIGIRVALGAQTSDILRSVAGTGLAVVAAGVAIGVAGAFGAARLLQDLLFGVSARDGALIGTVTGVLAVTALVANALPARRAARIDPMNTLRIE